MRRRKVIAIDEKVVKANKKHYYIYAAIDVERIELILMRVYPSRNYLTTKLFISEVLKKPKFVVDKAPFNALENLGLEFEHQTFRED